MDNRRLFIAALLSLAVLFLWQWMFPAERPQVQPVAVEASDTEAPDGVRTAESRPSEGEPAQLPEPQEPETTGEAAAGSAATAVTPSIEAQGEETVVFENEEVVARFSNRGGLLVSFELKQHSDSEGGRVDLVRRRLEGPFPFGLVDSVGDSHPLNDVLFAVERADNRHVVFEYSGSVGAATKAFRLDDDGLIEVNVEAGGEAFGLILGPGIRNPSAAEQANRFSTKSAIYQRAGEVETLAADAVKERTIVSGEAIEWVGLQDNYFLSSWVVESPLAEVVVQPYVEFPEAGGGGFRALAPGRELSGDEKDLPRELSCVLQPRGTSLEGRIYLGAKQYDRLRALANPRTDQPYGLEESVALGFFGFFSKLLLAGLQWIYQHVVANYGWAIILMTVLIRILLFPLTHKSFVSMQKMQELNPKIQAIRQKYRSKLKDKQGRPNAEAQRKMNEEVMGLYKKEGVNPAGGCLPMLLQLPVLFAFYRLLSAAVELRHAPWFGWIQDLSAPDPFYILPLVMGASQFIQQKMTPSTADPMQRRIFMLMPVFFTVLFLGFPSGMVLYWLTNNVLGIAQQAAYRRIRQQSSEAN